MGQGKLILLRHGQSVWNKKNLFTGWVDIPLSPEGIEEARRAGEKLSSMSIDFIFTSALVRSFMTALIAMAYYKGGKTVQVLHPEANTWHSIHSQAVENEVIPLQSAWQLNERMYGQLQGLNKDEIRQKYGDEQVKSWRRSFDVAPPEGESLKMTGERTLPYFQEVIMPRLQEGKNVLVAAHGNSLRSIIMFLEKLSGQQIVELEIPFAEPLIYTLDGSIWKK